MLFKYIGKREGVFYGTHVVPGEQYDFSGNQCDLALKSQDFKYDFQKKKTKKHKEVN